MLFILSEPDLPQDDNHQPATVVDAILGIGT